MELRPGLITSKARLSLCLLIVLTFPEGLGQVSPDTVQIPIPVNCGDRIQVPGLYVLTRDLDCSEYCIEAMGAVRPAIEILASDVRFDLQGFTLSGGSISVSDASKVKITNGQVGAFSSFQITGIVFSNVRDSRLEGVTVRSYWGGTAFAMHGGGNNLIRDNLIGGDGTGVWISGPAVGNTVVRNVIWGDHGLEVTDTVRDTVIVSNEIYTNFSIAADIRGSGTLFEDCRVFGALRLVADNNIIRNNTVVNNGPLVQGLHVYGSGNLIERNTVAFNSFVEAGNSCISVGGSGNVIRANTASGAPAYGVDLRGAGNTCTENKWRNNTFGTASPECIR